MTVPRLPDYLLPLFSSKEFKQYEREIADYYFALQGEIYKRAIRDRIKKGKLKVPVDNIFDGYPEPIFSRC